MVLKDVLNWLQSDEIGREVMVIRKQKWKIVNFNRLSYQTQLLVNLSKQKNWLYLFLARDSLPPPSLILFDEIRPGLHDK